MKTSTIVFNVAAAVFLLAIFIGVVDLMSNKTKSYGVTPTPQPDPTLDPTDSPSDDQTGAPITADA